MSPAGSKESGWEAEKEESQNARHHGNVRLRKPPHAPPYGCDTIHAPNFARLAQRTVTFDNSYICSMPCMPARRDLHTGRPNFLHRSWGPLEPFDDSMPRLLRDNGTSSHMISDHYHYWEDGGANYHAQYDTWQFIRGQEGDPWMGQVSPVPPSSPYGGNASTDRMYAQDRINRQFLRSECDQPQTKTFAAGLDFMRRNEGEDNWFLQIETFDPHEPFFSQRQYQDLYPELIGDRSAALLDWPSYAPVTEPEGIVDQCRGRYSALLSMCDARLGDVIDEMDRQQMWDDTMLIVWTDHGFLLGEHDHWAKLQTPWYGEMAHTPFFVWDPRCGKKGERRASLVQPSIDLGPTLLEYFDLEPTADMLGKSLADAIDEDKPAREAAIFGNHGGHVNVTDGRYVYMRACAGDSNGPLYNYTLMPAKMRDAFPLEELATAEMVEPFSFTKGCRLMRTEADGVSNQQYGTLLFDLEQDPGQEQPLKDPVLETRFVGHMRDLMQECDAPEEQFERLGL